MPLYLLINAKLKVLKEFLDKIIKEEKIRPLISPVRALILFVLKKDNTLRFCVDYYKLNRVTVKNRGILPLVSEMLNRIKNAVIFTKIDLKDTYYRIRIAKGDEWKTAFGTRYGHFKFLVIPIGLINALATF
jgi:hypothetical protein